MAASLSEPLAFAPSARTLAFALEELDELGTRGGGANEPVLRRASLEAYLRFGRERRVYPPRWRYDYAALSFEDVYWLTGRALAPAPAPVRKAKPAVDEPGDAAALAVENAGGLVHLGAIYLQSPPRKATRA